MMKGFIILMILIATLCILVALAITAPDTTSKRLAFSAFVLTWATIILLTSNYNLK